MDQLKRILPYYRPYRRGLLVGLGLVALSNISTIAAPYLIKLAIDSLESPDVTRRAILAYAGLIVAVTLLGGAAKYGMRELLNGISRRMETDLRNDFLRHLLRLDASFYGKIRTGDLMSRATNDIPAVRQAVGPAVMYSVNTAVSFVFALGLMLWISPRLTLFAIIPMILLPPVVLGFGKVIHRRFEAIQEQFSTVSTMVQENLTGVRIVRAYVQEDAQARDFAGLNAEYMDRNMSLVKAAGLFHPVLGLLSGAGMVVVLWLGGQEVIAGRITVGDFVAFGIYLNLLTWPLIALGWVVTLFQRGAASMGRINRIMDTAPEIAAPPDPVGAGSVRGAVTFRNVSFRYPGTERTVLENVSFTAEPGQVTALVGPTGSGKTTLVSLIPRIHDPTEGEVLVDGIPVDRYDPAALRSTLGVVPQDPFLFSDTIEANIGLGVPPEDLRLTDAELAAEAGEEEPGHEQRSVVERSARIAQLHDSIQSFPREYGTRLGERGINLSGGQKQRATLARALARDPVILILDDALSAVDTRTEARILADLRRVMKERTSFIISHRLSAVMDADQILVLEDGEIVERGTHDELVGAGGTYTRLVHRQMLEEDLERDRVPVGSGD